MPRTALSALLLLAFVAQAASAVHDATCPMIARAGAVERSGCEHCPPPPADLALRSALPDCCAMHAAKVESSVSEPARPSHPASAVALCPPRVVASPVPLPLVRTALFAGHAPAPPPPPRNLPLLS